MHYFNVTDKANKVIWIKYFYENTNSLWKNYILESAGVNNMNIFFRSNFSECMIPNYSELSAIIQNWKLVHYQDNATQTEMKLQWVWYNSRIFVNKFSQFFSGSLFQAGLRYIKAIFDEYDTIIPFNIWLKRAALHRYYLMWRKLVSAAHDKYNL